VWWSDNRRRGPREYQTPSTKKLIIFGLFFLAVVLPVIWFATRSITIPTINKLTIASKKIAQGSLDEAVSIPGKNEISVLAQSFDIMRTKLKDSIESLQQRTKELEGLNAECQTL
jgi:nitrate/nitrite-specific signal transduction histidine kinase